MKRIVAMILALLMVLSLAACGGSDTKDTSKETTKATEATKKADDETKATEPAGELSKYEQYIADAKAKAAESGKYEKVTFTYYNWFGVFPGQQRIVDAINEIAHEEIGIDIDFKMTGFTDYRTAVPLALSAGEDIGWFGGNAIGYTQSINDGYCYDLEENNVIYDYAPDVVELIGSEFLDACKVGGTLFGICPMKDIAITYGALMIGKEYLDGIGYEYVEDPEKQEVLGVTWDEIDNIFAQLHAKYPDINVWTPATNWFTQGSKIDPIGGDSYGVLEDPINSLEVTNLFGCDEWNERLAMVRKWNELGYLAKDAMTETLGMNSLIKGGTAMAMLSQAKPGYKSQISGECGREMIVFRMGDDIVKASGAASVISCLAYNVENVEAHLIAMNFFYTNAEAMQLLCWGQEGKEYKYTEDGHVTFADGVDSGNSEWYHTCNWALPNQYLSTPWVGDPLDLGAKTMEFNAKAGRSKAMGFTFDNSDYSAEYTAINNKYQEYYKGLLLGFVDPTEGTKEMNDELVANGLNEYIEAKRTALNEWAAKMGVK